MSAAHLSADVAILGAGPAGLAAALQAARAGHQVVVVERAGRVGGMAASFEVAGVRVDHGSHRLHPSIQPEILAELRRLLGDELQWRPRRGRIRLDGRWISFPLRGAELVRRLPPSFVAGVARDAAVSPLRRVRNDTFAEEVRARLGPTMGERFYFPYARKLWGAEPNELSGEHARRRIGASSPWALAARALPRTRLRTSGFWYPARGFGRIVEMLAEVGVEAGADIRLGAAVERVVVGEGACRVVADDGTVVDARHVWSTLPLPLLSRLTGGPDPAGLEHRAMVLLYLAISRRQWTEYDAHYLPGAETPATRVSEPRNYRAGPDLDDRTVLCVEIPCAIGDDVWSAEVEPLAEGVVGDLATLGLPEFEPFAVEVRRLPAAYPIYRPGFERDLAAAEEWVSSLQSVITLGRHGFHAHDNTHHALAMGWAAAGALRADGSFDDAQWARCRVGFRAHVVED